MGTQELSRRHPLVRALALRRLLRRDLAVVVALAAVAALADVTGLFDDAVAFVIAAGVAALAFAIGATAAGVAVHERTLDLIAQGRELVPLPEVARERERLLSESHRQMLIRTLAYWRTAAQRPRSPATAASLPINPGTVQAADAELRELEWLLAQPTTSARAVVLTRRLIVDARSPIRGRDVHRLREELRRICVLLVAGRL